MGKSISSMDLECIIPTKVTFVHVECRKGFGTDIITAGENFIPPGLADVNNTGTPAFNSSLSSFQNWLSGFLPNFSDRNIQRVEALYPETGSSEEILIYNTTYTRAGLIYRDVVLACPSYWMARAAYEKNYVGEYSISPAKHASDTEWVGPPPLHIEVLTEV